MKPLLVANARERYKSIQKDVPAVDRGRLEAVLNALSEDGTTNLAVAVSLTFPDKKDDDALTAFRQLRDRLRKLERGITLEVQDLRRTSPKQRLVWFEAARQNDEAFAVHNDLNTKTYGAFIEAQGVKRDDFGKMEILICIRGGWEKPHKEFTKIFFQDLRQRLASVQGFVFQIIHAEEIELGQDRQKAKLQNLNKAHLVLAMLSAGELKSQPDIRVEFERDLDFVIPILLDDLDPTIHDLREFGNREIFKFKNKPIARLNKSDRAEAMKKLIEHLYQFVEQNIQPIAETWEINEAVVKAFAKELKTDHVLIPSEGTKVKLSVQTLIAFEDQQSTRLVAIEYLDNWLERDERPPFMALLGEYGIGKTTTLKAWCRQRQAAWQQDRKHQPMPIYINLSRLSSVLLEERSRIATFEPRESQASKRLFQLTAEEMLDAVLESMYTDHTNAQRLAAKDVIDRLQNDGALLILDSLDEVLVHLTDTGGADLLRKLLELLPTLKWLEETKTNTYNIVRTRKDGGCVGCMVIACRTHYFPSITALSNQFLGQQRSNFGIEHFDAFLLHPFRDEQILHYLEQLLPERNAAELFKTLAEIHNLPDLMTRPYHLKLIGEQIADLELQRSTGKIVNAASLYINMVRASMLRDDTRHWLKQQHKQELLAEIAWQLHVRGESNWHIQNLEEWFLELLENRPTWKRALSAEPRQLTDQLLEDLRTATFLVHEHPASGLDEHFRFAHRSMQEFFLARALLHALRLPVAQCIEKWAVPFVSDETYAFLEQLLVLATPAEQKEHVQGWATLKTSGNPQAAAQLLCFVFSRFARERVQEANNRTLPDCPLPDLSNGNYSHVDFVAIAERSAIVGREQTPLNLASSNLSHAKLAGLTVRHLNLFGIDLTDANVRNTVCVNCLPYFENKANLIQEKRQRMQMAHQSVVGSVGFSPDGNRIVSGSSDGSARVWDAKTGTQLLRLNHQDSVQSVVFSPDGSKIVAGSSDGSARVWDAKTGTQLLRLNHQDSVQSVVFSPDGGKIASGSKDRSIRVWDAKTGTELLQLQHKGWVQSVAFSPDGLRIISGSTDCFFRIWDTKNGVELLRINCQYSIRSVAFSPDSSSVVLSLGDGSVRVWDVKTKTEVFNIQHKGLVYCAVFSPNNNMIVSSSSDDSIQVWNSKTGAKISQFNHQYPIQSVVFSSDSSRILSCSQDSSVQIWDVKTGIKLLQLNHKGSAWSAVYSPDGSRILSCSQDSSVQIWDVKTGIELLQLNHKGSAWSAVYSPDGSRIAFSSYDDTIEVWDIVLGTQISKLKHNSWIEEIEFSPDGFRVVSGSGDNFVRVWDIVTGTQILQLEHRGSINSVAFSPDGSKIISGSDDKSLRVWDTRTGIQLFRLNHQNSVNSVAFSPDGSKIASSSSDKSIRLWNANTGNQLFLIEAQSLVKDIVFSPDNSKLVSILSDNFICFWDTLIGGELCRLECQDEIYKVSFSPDGLSILSSANNGFTVWTAQTDLATTTATFDQYNQLHATGFKSVISCTSIGADPAQGIPDTVLVLDLLEERILHKKGDWWRLTRRVWQDENGYQTLAETAFMNPFADPPKAVKL